MNNTQVTCRRCGCTKWNLFTTTSLILDTSENRFDSPAYIKREFRCINCNTKATIDQANRLEAMSQSPVETSS